MSLRALATSCVFNVYFRLKGCRVPQVRRFLARSQFWAPARLRGLQDEALRDLVRYAYEHVPYYRAVMRERGLQPGDIRTQDDLRLLPVLTKEGLRRNWESLRSDEARRGVYLRRTGGSTGEPLGVLSDDANGDWENAAGVRGMGWMGYHEGDPIAVLFGGSLGLKQDSLRDRLRRALMGETFLPAFEIRPENALDYAGVITRKRLRFLRGYASALYILARLLRERGAALPLAGVSSTAETLLDFQRETMEQVYGCRVSDQYGCGELNSIAFEAADCGAFHVSDELVILESLKGTEPAGPGEAGALTFTGLRNYAMPLIRYQNGDIVGLGQGACSCRRGLSHVSKVFGRSNDMLVTAAGDFVSGAFIPHLFRTGRGIAALQVVQEAPGRVLLKIVKDADFQSQIIEEKARLIEKYLGVAPVVEYVDDIPRTPSGKLKTVISRPGGAWLWK